MSEDPFRLELHEFRRAIADSTPARVGPRDGLEALRIALAADESPRTGVSWTWDGQRRSRRHDDRWTFRLGLLSAAHVCADAYLGILGGMTRITLVGL